MIRYKISELKVTVVKVKRNKLRMKLKKWRTVYLNLKK